PLHLVQFFSSFTGHRDPSSRVRSDGQIGSRGGAGNGSFGLFRAAVEVSLPLDGDPPQSYRPSWPREGPTGGPKGQLGEAFSGLLHFRCQSARLLRGRVEALPLLVGELQLGGS